MLLVSVPGSLRDALTVGGVLSRAFLEDLPKRLTGPGRFLLQPLMAIALGIRGGVADARASRAPYLMRLLTERERRDELARAGLAT